MDDSQTFSAHNSIFNLQNSHGVNRPGVIAKQEKEAIRNIEMEFKEADFAGESFLAGQRAPMTHIVKKPTEIRRGREFHSRSRPVKL